MGGCRKICRVSAPSLSPSLLLPQSFTSSSPPSSPSPSPAPAVARNGWRRWHASCHCCARCRRPRQWCLRRRTGPLWQKQSQGGNSQRSSLFSWYFNTFFRYILTHISLFWKKIFCQKCQPKIAITNDAVQSALSTIHVRAGKLTLSLPQTFTLTWEKTTESNTAPGWKLQWGTLIQWKADIRFKNLTAKSMIYNSWGRKFAYTCGKTFSFSTRPSRGGRGEWTYLEVS